MLHAPEASSGEIANLGIGFGPFWKIIAFFVKLKGFAVEAIPSASWWGAVGEDVTQMGPAASAANFCPHHAMRLVLNLHDVALGDCTIERRPAGATGELAGGLKQREAAHHAAVDAVLFVVEEGAAERSFGA